MVQLIFVIPCMLFYYDLLQIAPSSAMRERGDLGFRPLLGFLSQPLRYDPVVENGFALAIPDDVGQVGVAGNDLCHNTAGKQA